MMKTTNDLKYYENGTSTMMDDTLFSANQLYHMLQPSSDGGIIGRYKKMLLVTFMLITGLLWMQIVRLYLSLNDLQLFLYKICEIIYLQTNIYKAYIVVTNIDRLWNLLDVTRYGFTTCSTREPYRLYQSRKSLTFWLKTSTIFILISVIIWMLTPCFITNIAFINQDGTLEYYKASIFNFWYPISVSTYNWLPIWFLLYAIEAYVLFVSMLVFLMFDCYLVIICTVISVHFDTISAAYGTLGHRPPIQLSSDTSGMLVKIKDTESYYHDELILYIKDSINLVKILDEFYNNIRTVVLIQMIVDSVSTIMFLFSMLLAFKMGDSIVSIKFMQYLTGYLLVTCQLFIYCYIFNLVDTAKSTLNSGLYNSNCTEMNFKFQKTLLLSMYMNSAHKRQMKVSPKLIVNLELFMAVMRLSYSIVSVLLNVST